MSVPNTRYGEKTKEMLRGCRSVYFIGIGGISMSYLAVIAGSRGMRVAGSDRAETDMTRHLRTSGIEVHIGHAAEHIRDFDAVVYTLAISPDNPEYVEALRLGKQVLSRADYLGYLMSDSPVRVGVAGMHGKSSTTSMCAQVLVGAGTDPTVVCGAETAVLHGSGRMGGGDVFLFEACEYMDSFLDFLPNIAVILNVDMDHVDYFKDMEQVRTSFGRYASLTGRDGFTVIPSGDEEATRALAGYEGHIVTFSDFDPRADFYAANTRMKSGCGCFDILHGGEFFCHVDLRVAGGYQISNATAAAAACYLCGVDAEDIGRQLSAFTGAERRMEYKGKVHGAAVYDDYGHHPTEVLATLKGAAQMGYERLLCVFQSHTYSRTRGLWNAFLTAFSPCDKLYVAEIYAARETDTLGITPPGFADALNASEGRAFASAPGDLAAIAAELHAELRPGDALVVMGAGDIYKLFDELEFDKNTDED